MKTENKPAPKEHNINNYIVDIRIAFERIRAEIDVDLGIEDKEDAILSKQYSFSYAAFEVLCAIGKNDPVWGMFLEEALNEVISDKIFHMFDKAKK